MTREQLDAIDAKARVAYHWPSANQSEADREVIRSVVTLLAEVERLTADPLPAAAWVREVQQTSFARGAEAMRAVAVEVASKRANLQRLTDSDMAWGRSAQCILDELRHLPVPEDK